MNGLPYDVCFYSLLSFLNESDHTIFARTNKDNYKQYSIKKYKQQYIIHEIPPAIIAGGKLTNIIINDHVHTLPNQLKQLCIYNGGLISLPNNILSILPNTLISLYINNIDFNVNFASVLPSFLKILHIRSDVFNQPIDNLPNKLTNVK